MRKPAKSLNATRTKVAAPPVSRIAAVPSAYERATTRKSSPTDAEHRGRHPERVQRDDPEREVDRGGDLAVGDGGERRRVEDTLQPRELAGHAARTTSDAGGRGARTPSGDEEHAEQVAERCRRPRARSRRGARRRARASTSTRTRTSVRAGRNRSRGGLVAPAATMTRQGALRRTKSTVSPKIRRRPRWRRTRRGPPMTMISAPRRVASSTIARPALRVRGDAADHLAPRTPRRSRAPRRAGGSPPRPAPAGTRRAAARAAPGSRSPRRSPRAARSRAGRRGPSPRRTRYPGATGTRMLRYSSAVAGPITTGRAHASAVSGALTTRRR